MSTKYPVGTRLRCVAHRTPFLNKSKLVGELATVFHSREYGLGVRFDCFDYRDDDDPVDSHSIENFEWEVVAETPKKGLVAFLRKLEESA